MIDLVNAHIGRTGSTSERVKVRLADSADGAIDRLRLHIGRALTRVQRRLREMSAESSTPTDEAELEYHRRMMMDPGVSASVSERLAELRRERDAVNA